MMDISVIQDDEFKNWTAIPNRLILDELLKSDEVRLYCYLKSRPSNWKYSSEHIKKLFGWSKNKTSSVMSSLRKSGWIELSQIKSNSSGKFSSAINCIVKTEPEPYPKIAVYGENRITDIPCHEKTVSRKNRDYNNTEENKKNKKNKKTLSGDERENSDFSFSQFRTFLTASNFAFTIEKGCAGFLPTTLFRITATGYVHNVTAGRDVDASDAQKIWEHLFKNRSTIIQNIQQIA